MNDIIGKFTNHLKNALTRALCLAVETQKSEITPLHLVWALQSQQGCVAAEILEKSGSSFKQLQLTVGDSGQTFEEKAEQKSTVPALSEAAKIAIEKAVLAANTYEHKYIGTEHLLSGLLQSSREVREYFEEAKVNVSSIQTHLTAIFRTSASFPDLAQPTKSIQNLFHELEHEEEEDDSKQLAIDFFTDEMTTEEAVEKITPVIGRDTEIHRLANILARKQKNNPILIGKPGVGKTAVVEGLAKNILEDNVPAALSGKRILRLDLASMIAGTMYRGEFESRLRQLIEEVTERPDIILFIDEIHTIMGAGAASGSLDAANILKPALARGEIRCIGATTPDEFKKFIETDGALERRFQQIPLREPTKEETRSILEGIKSFYEKHHHVEYSDEALARTIELADKYLHGKAFPDKAIDVLDEAGSLANHLKRKRKKDASIFELQKKLAAVKKQKKTAVTEERFEEAMQLKEEELLLEKTMKERRDKATKNLQIISVDESIITETVSHMCGISLDKLSASEQKELKKLETTLNEQVIGQNKIVAEVAKAIQRSKLGLGKKERPLASFLFLGPSGVGKTHLAKTLAKNLFAHEDSFLRLDMSEYSEPFTISKLIGSPAGYVGYRESTKLTDHIKQHPHTVILFDEIEKAHGDVHNLLLQILDDGMLTDATGRKINFRNTYIILTTNAGKEFLDSSTLGFALSDGADVKQQRMREALEQQFKVELLNRIQHICAFERLSQESIQKISEKELAEIGNRLEEKNIHYSLHKEVAEHIAKKVRAEHGARDIHRVIEEQVEHAIAEQLLSATKQPKKIQVSTNKTGKILVKSLSR